MEKIIFSKLPNDSKKSVIENPEEYITAEGIPWKNYIQTTT